MSEPGSRMARLRQVLNVSGAARLRKQYAALEREVARLRSDAERLEARIAELSSTLASTRARAGSLARKLDDRRRSALSPEVLRQVMKVRAGERAIDPFLAAAAEQRERRFAEASASYRRHVEAGTTEGLERIKIDGLAWWMPLDPRLPERAARTERQGFPYRVLLQTREVAVGGVMLDLGGNIGRTSVVRALLGDVTAVYAAEPEPANYAALVQNVLTHGMRGLVLPDQVAIGAERGEVQLHRSRFMGGHRVLFGREYDAAHQVVRVPCWPVDAWMEHVGCDPRAVTFVKVDVQGSEIDLLRGAAALLARRQAAWQVEIDPGLLAKAGRGVPELLALVRTHFTHFIDIGSPKPGPRLQPVDGLAEWLDYLGAEQVKTDLILLATR